VCERFEVPSESSATVTIQVAEDDEQVLQSLRNSRRESYPPYVNAQARVRITNYIFIFSPFI